jgi:amino-acid N-acetyltransferase
MATMTQIATAASPASGARKIVIRPATTGDAGRVYQLISENLVSGHLLARPLGEVELHVPRFLVATDGEEVVGCGELARLSPTVAEVRSLVVEGPRRGTGVGRRLLENLIAEAVSQRFPRLCAFTHQARPFVRAGFSIVPHPWVPAKIAADCQTCELFRRCRQYAVVLDLKRTTGAWR